MITLKKTSTHIHHVLLTIVWWGEFLFEFFFIQRFHEIFLWFFHIHQIQQPIPKLRIRISRMSWPIFRGFKSVSSQIIWLVKSSVKLRFSKKATKFEKNLLLVLTWLSKCQNKIFFEILWISGFIVSELVVESGEQDIFLRKCDWRKNFATLYFCTPKIKLNYFMHCLREGF